MNSEITRQEDGTILLKITVPWKEVEVAREKVIDTFVKSAKISGFRPGKAPRNVVEEKIPKESLQEEILKEVLPKAYNYAVSKEKLTPILTPHVHVETFEDGTDLVFTAETCEEPSVELGSYKEEVKNVTAKSKIVVPGKEPAKASIDEILESVMKTAKVKISKVLADQETNRLLSQLLDELKSLGLSLDQYLASRNKKSEELRREFSEKATRDLMLEFVLRKIANEEKIVVEQKDIDDAISKVEDTQQREEIRQNPYLLSAIIRQQKTLDYLSNL